MKILHVAPINVAGVPYNMMEMQRRHGHEAALVTLHRNTLSFPEDICLDLPLPRNPVARWWRTRKRIDREQEFTPERAANHPSPRIHRASNIFEYVYFRYDDVRRRGRIQRAFSKHQFDQYDVIHYDGGLDFFRDSRVARRWKTEGKKIICHYMGSDLRVRGVDPTMEKLSDLNLTNESDHLLLHPNIHYLFIPFDVSPYAVRTNENDLLRIIHSPSNRAMKGTRLILPVIEKLKKERKIDFVLLEGTPHARVIEAKKRCDIAIEQVGNFGGTGYGRNSLEFLAMGIPTITEMTPDYVAWLPENPFVLANADTLYDRLLELIDNPSLRREKGMAGRRWVEQYHSYESVHRRLTELYREHHIC